MYIQARHTTRTAQIISALWLLSYFMCSAHMRGHTTCLVQSLHKSRGFLEAGRLTSKLSFLMLSFMSLHALRNMIVKCIVACSMPTICSHCNGPGVESGFRVTSCTQVVVTNQVTVTSTFNFNPPVGSSSRS